MLLDRIIATVQGTTGSFEEAEANDVDPRLVLLRKILDNPGSFERAGIRNQFKSVYRGRAFIIGVETRYDMVQVSVLQAKSKVVSSKLVLTIADKDSRYPTDGLRIEQGNHGAEVDDALQALYVCACELYDREFLKTILS